MGLIAAGLEAHVMDRPGGIFVRRATRCRTRTASCSSRSRAPSSPTGAAALAEQIDRRGCTVRERAVAAALPSANRASHRGLPPDRRAALPRRDLLFFNGLGGFTPDGREYVITLGPGQATPAPWVNVLANPQFGTVVSESGIGLHLGRERPRVPPDALAQRPGRATRAARRFYLRDEESGRFWSPDAAARPRRARPTSAATASATASSSTREDGIVSELCVYVAARRPGQVLGAEDAQHVRPRRAGSPSPATWSGCWATCGRNGHARGHRDRSGKRRALRPQRLQHRVRRPRRLLRRRAIRTAP